MNKNKEKGSSVLARVYFHDLPDEQDYEVHDEKHMSGGCAGCVPAYIIPRAAWDDAQAIIAQRDARIEEQAREIERDGSELLRRLEVAEREFAALKAQSSGDYFGEFSKGDTYTSGDDGKFEAGINHRTIDANDMVFGGKIVRTSSKPGTWFQRIVVHGSTSEQAKALRDVVLARLNSSPVSAGGNTPRVSGHAWGCRAVGDYKPGECNCGAGVVDERAAFEAAWPLISAQLPSHQRGNYDPTDVEHAERNAAQEGWQARAALNAGSAVPEGWRDMLTVLQWQWEAADDHFHTPSGHYCPSCRNSKDSGHDGNCEIAALLDAAPTAKKEG